MAQRRDDLGNTDTLIAILIGDVIEMHQRLATADTAANRRELVRTSFAAIDGAIWLCRQHVRSVAEDLDVLTPTADLALRERSFVVRDNGEVIEQVRFLTLPTVIKLIASQAKLIQPDYIVDLNAAGWEALKAATLVRNRVTHPKRAIDLEIGDDELAALNRGLNWLLAYVETVMGVTTLTLKDFAAHVTVLHEQLRSGDAKALEAYNSELQRRASASVKRWTRK